MRPLLLVQTKDARARRISTCANLPDPRRLHSVYLFSMRRIRKAAVGLLASITLWAPAAAEALPAISVKAMPAAAPEGARFLFTFTREGELSGTSSVAWTFAGAVDGADFGRTDLPRGTVNFKVGQAQKGFWISTVDDQSVEPDESFEIILSGPRNATVDIGVASATITNNDVATRSPLTLVNPTHSAYWAREDAFLNHILLAGQNYGAWAASGLIDPVAARFVKMPANGGIKIGAVRGGGVPGSGDFYKGRWILDWEGDGDLSIRGGVGATTRVSPTRIEEDYDPALHGLAAPNIWINRLGPAGVSNIRFYRAEHEPLLAAGEVFDPRWLADMSRFDIIRPMDWTGVNGDHELVAADRPPANRPFYHNGRVPDDVIIRAAVDTGTQLWLNAPGLLGCPTQVAAILRDGSIPQSQRVAAAEAAFDEVMASPEPLRWARQIVALLNAINYPPARPLFIELDNEVWNTGFRVSTDFYSGIGRAVAARHGELAGTMRTGYGYQSARFAEAIAQALAEGGRAQQPWTMVLGAQTVTPSRTVDALEGVMAYNGPEPMRRYGVATTSYFFGGFRWHKDNLLFGARLDQATWRQRWLAELAADRSALYKRISDYALSPTPMRANIAYYRANARANKAAADAAGAKWIGNFEGDSTDSLDPELALNPDAVSLYRQWHESDEYGRAITAIAADIRNMDPSAIMATYIFCAARRTPSAPFAECTPWDQAGGDNAAWNALLKP